ncbi:phosphoethanolamine transferase [Alicycliphilus denitrificans]|uniref:Phosphoethanolamine transferase n=1 Tax=Alicycliphilus denitrificans TaxID=179636 RepID=A0A420KIJ6_9BURK|nr:phosphoethanolamine--lipid A transferase [Alicycliphilus denitrificans]RKJ99773.1 phosphoethanolamine transferase [Alicycliphilus denitrificans]
MSEALSSLPPAAPRGPLGPLRRILRQVDERLSTPLSAQQVVLRLSVYLVLAANWPLWLQLARIGGAPSLYMRSAAALAVLIACGMVAVFAFLAWTRGMKLLWWLVVLVAALSQYYMLTYSVVMDPGMAANVLQTDAHEVADLLSLRMLLAVLAVLLLPTWWLLRVRIPAMRPLRQAWRNLAMLALALGVAAGTVAATSRDLAPLMRNHPQLRYLMNPLASLYSTSVSAMRPVFARSHALVPMTQGAAPGDSYAAAARPLLFVLVVGETARADHFGINGYGRDTTPELAKRGVMSWRDVRSCGTSTLASLPCMFSPLGKSGFESRSAEYENLLDVAQAAGLAVLWLDNQSGCKGVCDRVPHAAASEGLGEQARAGLCDGGECRDEAMLHGLDARLAAMPAAQRERGVLLVLHQMGSHGPAYYKRSTGAAKRFMPECRTEVLADCAHGELVNAYDNSIAATDIFLGKTIDWLREKGARYDTGMLYLSDHGESLGEYGLFLHGMPYGMAPDVQKHVPMVAWLDDALLRRERLSAACLRAGADARLTHDNLYHTMLGLLDVRSPSYRRPLDAFDGCRDAALAFK